MAEASFTPGPWEVRPDGFVGYGHCVVRPAGDAELGNWMMAERIRREEDANLIAAAPELYEALAAIRAVFLRNGSREEYDNAYRQAGIAAMAKARDGQ